MKEEYWKIELEANDSYSKKIANEFLQSMKNAQKSPNTIDKYRRVLERFFVTCPKPINELASDDIFSWISTYYSQTEPRTNALMLSVLSSFFTFCLNEDYIDRALIKKRLRPAAQKYEPQYLNRSEQANIRLQLENEPLRNRALIELMLSSGCRCSEISALNIEDIDLNARTVQIKGQTGKIRIIHFSETAALLIKKYIKNRPVESALFVNKYNQRLMRSGIYAITTKLGKKAGIEKNLSPHCLRHTFATNLVAKGETIEFVSGMLGHKDLNVASMYYSNIPPEN